MIFMIYSDCMNCKYRMYHKILLHPIDVLYALRDYVICLFSMNQNISKTIYQ